MRTLVFCSLLFASFPLVAQSKKEMQDEIARLKMEIEQLKKPVELNLTDQHEQASYGLGVLLAGNIKAQGADSINMAALTAGISDVLGNKTLKMDQTQCMTIVQPYMQAAMTRKTAKARDAGKKFLDENKTKEGVKTTASGLQYKVITQGNGKQPVNSDRVTVHYTGMLTDGTIFDSSVQRGQPATFSLNGVISGWTEALQMMKEGDKWMLYIPYNLGYGERGSGAQIPPFSTLIFEVELIKVN